MKASSSYRYIGIDPGTNVLGYAIIEIVGKHVRLLDIGTLRMGSLDSHPLKLKKIFEGIEELILKYQPLEMAVEAPFYGKNPQSMLKLGRAQGVAIAAAMTNDVEVVEYLPKRIKLAVTGNGNASKEQLAAMLDNILKVKVSDYPLDATDALATAICHYYRKNSALGGNKKYSGWSSFLKDNPNRKG